MELDNYTNTEYILSLVFGGLCDTFWLITYFLIIRRGFKEKTYGMPMVALCTNLCWEFIFTFIYPYDTIQVYLNGAWFFTDLVLLYQYFKFGRSEFKKFPGDWFYPSFVISLVLNFVGIWVITYEFQDWYGNYTGFADNMLMSILFILMLIDRDSVKGQSLYIAIFKWLGTLVAFISVSSIFKFSLLLCFLYASVFVFDTIYITLLYQKTKQEGFNPFQRA